MKQTRKRAVLVTTELRARKRAVLVTTELRGVFFGYTSSLTNDDKTITLAGARLCVYWSPDLRGFMGLATKGPTSDCRIGPPATITLYNITSITEVAPDAVKAWEAAPWKS